MEKVNGTHKIKATQEQIKQILEYYDGYLSYNDSPYIIARIKVNSATITIYRTNIVLFQGENESREYNIWAKAFNLPLEISESANYERLQHENIIGSDEVGTGDYFGPIVVCACYVKEDQITELKKLGVKDSKLLSDQEMIPLGLTIAKMLTYSIKMLDPEKYNKLKGEKSNLNFVKAYLHNKAILNVKEKLTNESYDEIVIDEFTPKSKYFEYLKEQPEVEYDVTCIQKAEKETIAVAAASVIARVAFIKAINEMNNKYSFTFPKGAGPEVDKMAISFTKSYGYKGLAEVAKLKYSNTERVVNYFNDNPKELPIER